jgi:hypothetical protein
MTASIASTIWTAGGMSSALSKLICANQTLCLPDVVSLQSDMTPRRTVSAGCSYITFSEEVKAAVSTRYVVAFLDHRVVHVGRIGKMHMERFSK